MDEKQLLKKITLLKKIKPSQDWVFLTKRKILKDDYSGMREKLSFWQVFFTPIKRPVLVFAFRGIIVLTLVLTSGVFYLYYLNTQIVSNHQFVAQTNKYRHYDSNEEKKIVAMLEEMQQGLEKIKLSLDKIKNLKNQGQALVMSEVIKITADVGEKRIKEIKGKNSPSAQVLASLTAIENDYKELKEASDELQKEKLVVAFEGLKEMTLTEEQKSRLQKAEEYYNEGKHNEAMVLLVKIMEKK